MSVPAVHTSISLRCRE